MAAGELTKGYAEALFRVLQAEGELDKVEDELFRFGKLLESNYDLKQALSDQSLPPEQRAKVLDALLADKVTPHTLGLLQFIVNQGHARQLPEILADLSDIAADARNSAVAEVRTAVPLDEDQRKQLAAALSKVTGKRIELKALVDKSVLGGVYAKIGDTVIDGTVRRRLQQLKEQVRA
ncbi:MAG TPA: ATP synthase F1 subunit delta [Actinomycetota bacterium]|nr:ATP synthase F1 subunit delta [Actinomycetota bacterium]